VARTKTGRIILPRRPPQGQRLSPSRFQEARSRKSWRKVPDTIAVPIGAFADPTFPAPKVSVYEARRHPWTGIPADAEHHD
jgi:hypothetical protein